MTRYFQDAHFSDVDRPLFAFASYNAAPGTIAKMRKIAAERGLNPDVWFNNVEIVVAEKVGIETTTYVRNIFILCFVPSAPGCTGAANAGNSADRSLREPRISKEAQHRASTRVPIRLS
jgi:hypothetical protein